MFLRVFASALNEAIVLAHRRRPRLVIRALDLRIDRTSFLLVLVMHLIRFFDEANRMLFIADRALLALVQGGHVRLENQLRERDVTNQETRKVNPESAIDPERSENFHIW